MALATRDDLPALLNSLGLRGRAVEVGVQEGRYSAHILEHWEGTHLTSVDPWMADAADAYRDVANVGQAEHDLYHRRTVARLARYRERSAIWRMTGEDAAGRIAHASLDFVYLDARHDYVSVLQDLELWLPTLRPGAVFAGHDYIDAVFPKLGEFGVKSAVDGFFARLGLTVHSTRDDAPFVSWIVEMPKA
ncbi:class I SAM-dependent methyltransferase [Candidatus Poribacteria bacterium]|jgi:hypothetical protein|nr:class I SAM-dependent methyltransferase [Candidatus Poribacteria bacterium]MBT5532843.1 class I SAM-dependent methyltransferase [Candidatus Poribacteria bacterium]MBT5710475.1 class I SAM-dependent methyltransferase [Candidatus Poribacteria bacterium]MBT7100452.1 class I SAM-dependent methyltransferase [Candidatus Poribacteria bacterium]MBT7804937.1 class I SAM-dependent methyltransferase [Candidatus Poribacteria bacterium]